MKSRTQKEATEWSDEFCIKMKPPTRLNADYHTHTAIFLDKGTMEQGSFPISSR